ncbi:MAG: DUF1566 domain-containing protein [Deltaproteobacteria bacterium]|nr:DUF1566 domain-containing protein [Deltaproteobacteria bacterium]
MKRILVLVCFALFLGSLVSVGSAAAANRFVNNNDGTVTDTQTGLLWADHDSGVDNTWYNADYFCKNYSGGGKTGWRMPSAAELLALHAGGAYGSVIKKTGDFLWASETVGGTHGYTVSFVSGEKYYVLLGNAYKTRALPVRSGQ